MISRKHIYVVIRDEVTESFASKESLLVCLHFLNWIHSEPKVEGTFFQSMHTKGRTSGKNLGKNIVQILRGNKLAMADCRRQPYDGVAVFKACISSSSFEHKISFISTMNRMEPLRQLIKKHDPIAQWQST